MKLTVLSSIQHMMDEQEKSLEEKKVEVRKLLKDITSMFNRLNIPQTEQCPLCTGRICGEEELIEKGNVNQLIERGEVETGKT